MTSQLIQLREYEARREPVEYIREAWLDGSSLYKDGVPITDDAPHEGPGYKIVRQYYRSHKNAKKRYVIEKVIYRNGPNSWATLREIIR